eukprot:357323-Chlamydomonas_euryale.AAC.4
MTCAKRATARASDYEGALCAVGAGRERTTPQQLNCAKRATAPASDYEGALWVWGGSEQPLKRPTCAKRATARASDRCAARRSSAAERLPPAAGPASPTPVPLPAAVLRWRLGGLHGDAAAERAPASVATSSPARRRSSDSLRAQMGASKSARDLDREHARNLEREHARDLEREHARNLDREHARDLDREHARNLDREHARNLDREHEGVLSYPQFREHPYAHTYTRSLASTLAIACTMYLPLAAARPTARGFSPSFVCEPPPPHLRSPCARLCQQRLPQRVAAPAPQ